MALGAGERKVLVSAPELPGARKLDRDSGGEQPGRASVASDGVQLPDARNQAQTERGWHRGDHDKNYAGYSPERSANVRFTGQPDGLGPAPGCGCSAHEPGGRGHHRDDDPHCRRAATSRGSTCGMS